MRTPLLLTLTLGLGGCGLGTEIGNGFKDDGEGKAKKTAMSDKAPEESKAGNVPASAPDSDGKGGTGGGSADEGGDDGGDGAQSEPNAIITAYDASPLLAACATPFAGAYDAAFKLAKVKGETKTTLLTVTPADAAKGTVGVRREGSTELLRLVEPAPVTTPDPWAWSAVVTDAAAKPQAELYTCKDKRVETTNLTGVLGDVTKVSVVVVAIADAKETAVSWYAQSKTLYRIETKAVASPATEAPLVLEAVP